MPDISWPAIVRAGDDGPVMGFGGSGLAPQEASLQPDRRPPGLALTIADELAQIEKKWAPTAG
jgi:hypothetical protein